MNKMRNDLMFSYFLTVLLVVWVIPWLLLIEQMLLIDLTR